MLHVVETSVLFLSTVFHVKRVSTRCLHHAFRASCAARVTLVTRSKRLILGVPVKPNNRCRISVQGVFSVLRALNNMILEARTHVLRELRVLLCHSPFCMPAPLFLSEAGACQGGPLGESEERGHAEAQRVNRVLNQTTNMYVIVQRGGVWVLCLLMPPTLMPFVSRFCFCFWGCATHFFTAGWPAAWVNRKKVGRIAQRIRYSSRT